VLKLGRVLLTRVDASAGSRLLSRRIGGPWLAEGCCPVGKAACRVKSAVVFFRIFFFASDKAACEWIKICPSPQIRL